MPSIEGVRLKIERADEHLQLLETETDALIAHLYEHGVVKHVDTKTGDYVWNVDAPPSLTTHIAIIAGDFFHALRAALDHIVYELAKQDRPLTEFPIYLKPGPGRDGFHEAGVPKIWSLPIEAKVLVERFQPYEGWKGLKGKAHPLHAIRTIDNIDKHRRLLTVPHAVDSADVVADPAVLATAGGFQLDKGWLINGTGRFKHGDEVSRMYGGSTVKNAEHLDLKYRFQISIEEEGIAPDEIVVQLRRIYDFMHDEVMPEFAPFFT